jgi:hypothetical protein
MLTFLQLAKKVLEEEKQPLTTTEIWGRAEERGYTKDMNLKGRTPAVTAPIFRNIFAIFGPFSPKSPPVLLRTVRCVLE